MAQLIERGAPSSESQPSERDWSADIEVKDLNAEFSPVVKQESDIVSEAKVTNKVREESIGVTQVEYNK